jgi:hypothetical protein
VSLTEQDNYPPRRYDFALASTKSVHPSQHITLDLPLAIEIWFFSRHLSVSGELACIGRIAESEEALEPRWSSGNGATVGEGVKGRSTAVRALAGATNPAKG